MKPSDLTGFVILFISTLKSLFENNKHHYPDIPILRSPDLIGTKGESGVLDRLFEGYFQMNTHVPDTSGTQRSMKISDGLESASLLPNSVPIYRNYSIQI